MTHQLNLKVYIAGPMTGLPDNNYPAFNKAANDFVVQGIIPLNPATNKGVHWIDFMRASLHQIAQADAMYMLKDWQTSKGAKIEHQLAQDLHLPIFYENELKPKAKVAAEAKFDLQSNEQYRLQMAAISTASFGYWKESEGIHPDYDTVPLRDVAKLYEKYEALSKKYDALSKEKADHIKLHTKEISPGVKEGWTDTQSEAKLAEKVVQAAYAGTVNHERPLLAIMDDPSTGQEIRKEPEKFILQALDVYDNWVQISTPIHGYATAEKMKAHVLGQAPGLPVRILPVKKPV